MKYRINEFSRAAFAFAFLSLFSSALAFAQTTPPIVPTQTEQIYVISSQAGGVSHFEGDVKIKRAGSQIAQDLAQGDMLREKDRIVTGSFGRVEILLNPGSYLRIGDHSEVELTGTALDSLKIQIAQGSIIVEANTVGGKNGANISIATAQTVVTLEKAGLYRINATGVKTEIYVWEGLARVGKQAVKSGRRMTIGADIYGEAIVGFNRTNLDAFDLWSAARAEELAKINDRLRKTDLQNALAYNSWNDDYYYSGGYWVFDRRSREWCFVPYYGSQNRCCRAYGQPHNTAIGIKKKDNPVSVVYNSGKFDVSAVDVITKKSSGESSGSSSGKSDSYDSSSSPPSKSDSNSSPTKSDSSPPPTKSDPPSSTPPSKSDDSPPPSKKDGLK